jgi:hypothetical protein
MLTWRPFAAALLSSSISGCSGGQTGSPDCIGPTSCVCDTLYSGGALLRLHGESADEGRLVAVVDEVLGSVYGATDIRAGDRIGGELSPPRPCDPGDLPTLEGADLFVLFIPGSEGGYPSCDSQSEAACSEQRSAALLSGGYRFVIPWGDELDFGRNHRLPVSEVSVLTSLESCWERFPMVMPPCDDTREGCSVSQPATPSNGWPWAGAAVALAFVSWTRHRRRSA